MIDTLAWQPDPYPVYARLRRRGAHQLPDGRWIIARAADVAAVLEHPAAVVGFQGPRPSGAEHAATTRSGGRAGALTLVQATMARFSDGPDHDRRRAISHRHLRALDPADLRAQARRLTGDRIGERREIDVMDRAARHVPVAVLARALGVVDVDVAVAATRRLCLALAPPVGSPAVARCDAEPAAVLRRLLAPVASDHAGDDEQIVNVIALLFQAMDATAGLVGNAIMATHRHDLAGADAHDVVTETVRHDPPVQLTTRLAAAPVPVAGHTIPEGDRIVLLLAAANRDGDRYEQPDAFEPARRTDAFTFGVGARPCPGDAHAVALAAGVLDAVAATPLRPVHSAIAYERRANLRIPARVVLR